MSNTRVLIIEDEALIAEDIAASLIDMGFAVIGTALDSDEALLFLAQQQPDLVLLDINLNSELNGIQIAEYINKNYRLPFIFLTSYGDRNTVDRAKHTHPMGYIVKPFTELNLFSTIEIALSNFARIQVPDSISPKLINEQLPEPLTRREFEILRALYDGKTNKQMASDFEISINTIKTHVKRIFDKLNVTTRTQVITRLRELMKV